MRHLPAFQTTRILVGLIVFSVVLGGITGWLFRTGSTSMAWLNYIFSFTQVLAMGFFYAVWHFYRVRLPKGAWRAAWHVGFSSVFPLATLYMGMVLLFTFTMPAEMIQLPNGQQVMNRPDFLNNFGILYGCAFIVACFSGPVFAMISPFRMAVPLSTRTAVIAEPETVEPQEASTERQLVP